MTVSSIYPLRTYSKDARKTNLLKPFRVQEEQLRRLYALFYDFSKAKALELYNEDINVDKLYVQALKKMNDTEKELMNHMKKICVYIKSLTELRIDLEF